MDLIDPRTVLYSTWTEHSVAMYLFGRSHFPVYCTDTLAVDTRVMDRELALVFDRVFGLCAV